MKAYGYPAARPFNGQTLYSCTGVVVAGHLRRQPGPGPGLQHDRRVLRRRLDPERLACSSVTSFGYTGVKNILWGPYFGTIDPGRLQHGAAATT